MNKIDKLIHASTRDELWHSVWCFLSNNCSSDLRLNRVCAPVYATARHSLLDLIYSSVKHSINNL